MDEGGLINRASGNKSEIFVHILNQNIHSSAPEQDLFSPSLFSELAFLFGDIVDDVRNGHFSCKMEFVENQSLSGHKGIRKGNGRPEEKRAGIGSGRDTVGHGVWATKINNNFPSE